MTDAALLRAAVQAAGLSARQFALRVLGVHPQTVSNWGVGRRAMEGPTWGLLWLLAEHPELAGELAAARARRRRTRDPR